MAESIELRLPSAASRRLAIPSRATLARWLPWTSLAAVVSTSLFLNTWRLDDNGYGNTYYAAATRSMTQSWSNFFFGAFDPGGFITVDKPPVFLWFAAASARIFGYSSWSVLLPAALAGTASVALLWLIVRRYFGVPAATVAALTLALSPISVAVDRINLPEPFLILFLIGAAGAVLRSIDSPKWWLWVALAGALVGVAFNTKMLVAWIPGPAFALAIVAATPLLHRWSGVRNAALRLAVLAGATLLVSASWMLVVDAWPESSRPYVGGSDDDSVQDLVVDYNGIGRIDGEGNGPGGGGPRPANNGGAQPPQGIAPGGANAPQQGGNNNPPQGITPGGGNVPQGTAPGAGATITGRGGIIAGQPGLWRMFDDANGGQVAWLIPFALLGSILCAVRWRNDPLRRAATVLFAGWVLLFGLVFSYAEGIYHSYYTAALVPGIAALVGMTVVAASDLLRQNRLWLLALLPIVAITGWVQLDQSETWSGQVGSIRVIALVVLGAGTVAAVAWAFLRARIATPSPALALLAGGLLLIPGSWATYEATNPSMNFTLPQAGPREGAAGRSFGSQPFDNGTASLAKWLDANSAEDATWDLATTSAMQASTLIAQYDLSVMAIGGFSGSDPTITADQFAGYVESGEVRYVLTQGGAPGGAGNRVPGNAQPGGNGGPAPGQQGGFPGQPGTRGTGQQPPAGRGVQPVPGAGGVIPGQPGVAPTGAFAPTGGMNNAGANAVMNAVRSACTPVAGSDAPLQYAGSLYDCAGRAEQLRAVS